MSKEKTPTPTPATLAAPTPAPALPESAPAAEPTAAPAPDRILTQTDIDAAVAQAQKEWEKKIADEAAKAKMSEDERRTAEIEELRRENQMIKAESEVVTALKDAGANSPKLLFDSKRNDLEFKDGKLTNLKELVEELKNVYPEQFGTAKPAESIDAGAGAGSTPKGRADTLGSALKDFYKK